MSKAFLSVEGFLAEPQSSVTRDGKPILNVSVAHTPRKRDKQTGEFVDAGETLWVRAAFFGDQAEFLAGQVSKGDLVRLEGEPELREFTGKDGVARSNLEIKFANLLVIPRNRGNSGGSQWAGASQNQPGQANNSPWGDSSGGGGFSDSDRPF